MNSLRPLYFLTPRGLMKAALDVMQLSAETLRLISAGQESRVVWQELKNKLQAFALFEHVDSELNIPARTSMPLKRLVEQAYELEAYRALWATEGLGHYHTEMCWEQKGPPKNLLIDVQAEGLPRKSMAALHAGMGLSLANRLLKTLSPRNGDSEICDLLQQFVALCRDNSQPGYVGASYEALGLVARNLYPQRLHAIDRQLQRFDDHLLEYFWHGVGRAIYFAPTNFLPFNNSPWRAVELTQREPTHETGRLNALAGFVWALVLVNRCQPEILETLLKRHRGELSESDAFANGVSSVTMIWLDSTESDSYLDAFCRHRPHPSDQAFVEIWARQVLRPCQEAQQHFYPVVKQHDCLGEVFRNQSLPDLVAMLENRESRNRQHEATFR